VRLPINAMGILKACAETARTGAESGLFHSGATGSGQCGVGLLPEYDFISQREVLVTACLPDGSDRLHAMDTDGHHLWESDLRDLGVALVVSSPDGYVWRRETLAVTHSVNAYQPLDQSDIKGQLCGCFTRTGGVVLTAPASPRSMPAARGISPSGRRVRHQCGSIQVFELPRRRRSGCGADQKTQKRQTAH